MKLETTAQILTSALRQLAAVIERRNTIPILGCVKIDRCSIVGTDLDIELEVKLPASGAQGAICIDHRSLFALVRNIPGDETVRIKGDGASATVAFSTGRYDLPSLPASDWPSLTSDKTTAAEVDGDAFKRALAFVTPFISTEETRYYLNGVCLDGDVVVATDGHRLGCHPSGGDFSAFDRPIVPRKAVRLLQSLPAPKSIKIGGNRLAAAVDGARLLAKLIDGTFPDWRRVVPANADKVSKLTIDPRGLRQALARVASVMGLGRAYVTIAFDQNGIAVTGRREGATVREYVAVSSLDGDGQVLAFQANYLRDILDVFSGSDNVSLMIVDGSSPIRAQASGEQFAILMPARAGEERLAAETLAEWTAARSLGRTA